MVDKKITVETIMNAPGGPPCAEWTRERVADILSRLGCSSWVALAEAARAKRWRLVSLADLRMTAYRVATSEQRIAGVRRSVFVRVEADSRRWPEVSDEVQAVRSELIAWSQGARFSVDVLKELHATAYAAYAAYAACAPAYAAAAVYAAADAAAYAAYAAYAACAPAYAAADAADADAAAYHDESWAGLLFICRVLDGEESTP